MGNILQFGSKQEKIKEKERRIRRAKANAQRAYIESLKEELMCYEYAPTESNYSDVFAAFLKGVEGDNEIYTNIHRIDKQDNSDKCQVEVETVYGSDSNWYICLYTDESKAKSSRNCGEFDYAYSMNVANLMDSIIYSKKVFGVAIDPYDQECLFISCDAIRAGLLLGQQQYN